MIYDTFSLMNSEKNASEGCMTFPYDTGKIIKHQAIIRFHKIIFDKAILSRRIQIITYVFKPFYSAQPYNSTIFISIF
ncbi:hypothetical protein L246_32930 [Salmonella enterica subsp. enterica serovar Worthington str. BCH-5715]|nr:hypothetical protein L246_32930 [Salmonella enterica subsp. enterica serovar Worthington str. BCH-5715]